MLTLKDDTMLGDVPDSWDVKALRRLLTADYPGDWGEERGPSMTRVLRSTNLTNDGNLDLDDVALRALPADKVAPLAPRRGDILLERSGGGPGQPVGRVGLVTLDMPGYAFSNFLHLLRPDPDEIDPRFLGWVLYQVNRTGRVVRLEQQTTQMRNLHFRDYLTMPVPVPPPDEQAAIARILDAVETALERIRHAIAAAEALVVSLIDDAVAGEIATPGMRALKGAAQVHERLGRLPAGWSVLRLGTACTRIVDGTHQAVATAREGLPFLYVSCVRGRRIDWSKASLVSERTYQRISKGREPKRGSVLYTTVGSYGHAALVSTDRKFSFQRHIAVMYPREERLLGGYLALWMNSQRGKRWSDVHAVGNAQKTVTLTELSKMLVACPPASVQSELVETVQRADAMVDVLAIRLEALSDLKRALSHDLLTGRVRVGDVAKVAAT